MSGDLEYAHEDAMILWQVLGSFDLVPGLARCRIIIVCDGYKISTSCNFRGGTRSPSPWVKQNLSSDCLTSLIFSFSITSLIFSFSMRNTCLPSSTLTERNT